MLGYSQLVIVNHGVWINNFLVFFTDHNADDNY